MTSATLATRGVSPTGSPPERSGAAPRTPGRRRFTFTMLAVLVALPAGAQGMFELPAGKWRAQVPQEGDVRLETLEGKRLRLAFLRADEKEPVLVEGGTTVTATKMGDSHFTLAVTGVSQGSKKLAAAERLGAKLEPGAKLRFTAHFMDCGNAVQLCLHAETVTCADLRNEVQRECSPGPAIDGAKINAPPNLPPKK